MVEVVLRTFIPTEAIGVPYESDFVNGADNRGFNTLNDSATYRTVQKVDLDLTDPTASIEYSTDTGTTEQFSKDDASQISQSWRWELDEDAIPVDSNQLDKDTIKDPVVTPVPGNDNTYSINFDLNAKNPLPVPLNTRLPNFVDNVLENGIPIPKINANINVEVSRDKVRPYVYETNYEVSGTHDGFPAYELYIDRNLVYAYDPILAGNGPTKLFALDPELGENEDVDIVETSGQIYLGNRYRQDAEPGTAVGNTTGNFDTLAPTGASVPFGQIVGENTDSLLFDAFPATQNSLSFTGGDFQATPDDTFVLGELTYKNDVRGSNSNEEFSGTYSTDLKISSNSPISSSEGNFNDVLTEQINLNITQDTFENGDIEEQNPDIISFADNPGFGSFHVYEGKKGSVELLGEFDNDGNLSFAGFGEVLAEDTGFLN